MYCLKVCKLKYKLIGCVNKMECKPEVNISKMLQYILFNVSRETLNKTL